MNCLNDAGKLLEEFEFAKDLTRIACPILLDRRNNSLGAAPVTAAKHVRDSIIEKWPIDYISFTTGNTNAGNIFIGGFVSRTIESIFQFQI